MILLSTNRTHALEFRPDEAMQVSNMVDTAYIRLYEEEKRSAIAWTDAKGDFDTALQKAPIFNKTHIEIGGLLTRY
jgi:hypothetical protein